MRAPTRAGVALVAAVVLASLVAVAPRAGAGTFFWHQYNHSAGGIWMAGDPGDLGAGYTELQAYGFRARNLFRGGPEPEGSLVSVWIDSTYCDVANDRFVESQWWGSAPAEVTIDTSRLLTASWPAVAVPLTGVQYRSPLVDHDCAEWDWESMTAVDLPEASLTIGATFAATSELVVNTGRHQWPFWYESRLVLSLDAGRGRYADGQATFTADEPVLSAVLAALPAGSRFGSIGRDVHLESDVAPPGAPHHG